MLEDLLTEGNHSRMEKKRHAMLDMPRLIKSWKKVSCPLLFYTKIFLPTSAMLTLPSFL